MYQIIQFHNMIIYLDLNFLNFMDDLTQAE